MAKIPSIMDLMGGGSRGLDPTELRRFLGGAGPNNRYMDIGPYNAYLRRSHPRIPDQGVNLKRPVDLANIQRTDIEGQMDFQPAKLRNPKGRFRELMAMLEAEAEKQGYDAVYVEQIMNKFLPDVLGSSGYELDRNAAMMNPDTPSMYKRLGRGVQSGSAWRR